MILARSEAHQSHHVVVPEELLTHATTVTGERPWALIRADLVYFETTAGGAVFSVGSITFCGSLSRTTTAKQDLANAGKRPAAVPDQVNSCLDPMWSLRLCHLRGT